MKSWRWFLPCILYGSWGPNVLECDVNVKLGTWLFVLDLFISHKRDLLRKNFHFPFLKFSCAKNEKWITWYLLLGTVAAQEFSSGVQKLQNKFLELYLYQNLFLRINYTDLPKFSAIQGNFRNWRPRNADLRVICWQCNWLISGRKTCIFSGKVGNVFDVMIL